MNRSAFLNIVTALRVYISENNLNVRTIGFTRTSYDVAFFGCLTLEQSEQIKSIAADYIVYMLILSDGTIGSLQIAEEIN